MAALVLCLAGDVFLMLPADRFVPGLASFLLAHLAFTVGFLLEPGDVAAVLVVGVVLVAAVDGMARSSASWAPCAGAVDAILVGAGRPRTSARSA